MPHVPPHDKGGESFAGLAAAVELQLDLLHSLVRRLKDQHERELALLAPACEEPPEPELRRGGSFSAKSFRASFTRFSDVLGKDPSRLAGLVKPPPPPDAVPREPAPEAPPDGEVRDLATARGHSRLSGPCTPLRGDSSPTNGEESSLRPGPPAVCGEEWRSSVASSAICRKTALPKKESSRRFTGATSMLDTISTALLRALQADDELEVQALLEQGVDPNLEFGPFSMGLDFQSGQPLVLAVLRGTPGIVRLLAGARASLESEYSFLAGAEQKLWSGTAVHATIPSGNLDMLKELEKLGASLHAKGSNNCTLLWQACYFGKPDMCSYLLERGISVEHRAISQDDETLSFTPLHAASRQGFAEVVRLLLRAKANTSVDSGGGDERQPLEDAVAAGHCPVVELLVAAGADLFRRPEPAPCQPPRRASLRRSISSAILDSLAPPVRCIDRVFESRNPALVEAVALGLKEAPSLLNELSAKDLVEFLSCSGRAPLYILEAIFRPYALLYWEMARTRRIRMVRKAAHICAAEGMNVVEGPHFQDVIERLSKRKEPAPANVVAFIEKLAPQDPLNKTSFYSPATFFMCHVPMVHTNLNVLVALADCRPSAVFHDPGCQAIVNFRWRAARGPAYGAIAVSILEVLLLEIIVFALSKPLGAEQSAMGRQMRPVWLPACIAVSAVNASLILLELTKLVGYVACGLHRRYVRVMAQWYENLTLLAHCVVINLLLVGGPDLKDNYAFSASLGMVLFTAWMRVLSSMKAVEAVGLRILPMTTTLAAVGPFCILLLVFLLGSTSMYYTLGITEFPESFLILYRLIVLGDIDPYEMESQWAPDMRMPSLRDIANGTSMIESVTPEKTPHYYPVRFLMVVWSFGIGVLMMNLFVAILCRTYCEASDRAHEAFMRFRACKVLDHKAMCQGLQLLLLCRRRRGDGGGEDSSASSAEGQEDPTKAMHRFIWYCRPREAG